MERFFGKSHGFWILAGAVALLGAINLSMAGTVLNVLGLTIGRATAWLLSTLIFVGLLAYVGQLLSGRLDGVFIDDRNRVSLSRLQLVLWTVLLAPALLTAAFSNIALGRPDALAIHIPKEVWALLGLGAFSFVAAPAMVESRRKDPLPDSADVARITQRVQTQDNLTRVPTADTNVPSKLDAGDARWRDIVRGDTLAGYDSVDVSKVQQLAFTVILILIYGSAVYSKMLSADVAAQPFMAFPPVDKGFVALLGVSHASYLAYKKTAQ
jgi:hypothetical protein